VIGPLARHLGFLAALLAERLCLGDSFLQRRDVGFQGLECTAFIRVFVQVFVRASARRMSGFLDFEIDKDASFAIIATLPRPPPTDGLLARGFCRDVETLGKLAVRQPGFSHWQISVQVFVCLYDRAVSEWLLAPKNREEPAHLAPAKMDFDGELAHQLGRLSKKLWNSTAGDTFRPRKHPQNPEVSPKHP
jgi:hypothetical protein